MKAEKKLLNEENAQKVNDYVKSNGMSLSQLSRDAGVSRQYIWMVMKGKRPASQRVLSVINGER